MTGRCGAQSVRMRLADALRRPAIAAGVCQGRLSAHPVLNDVEVQGALREDQCAAAGSTEICRARFRVPELAGLVLDWRILQLCGWPVRLSKASRAGSGGRDVVMDRRRTQRYRRADRASLGRTPRPAVVHAASSPDSRRGPSPAAQSPAHLLTT
jgi:hypothetical protein